MSLIRRHTERHHETSIGADRPVALQTSPTHSQCSIYTDHAAKRFRYPDQVDMPNPTPFPAPADDLRLVISDMDGTLLDGDGNIPRSYGPCWRR